MEMLKNSDFYVSKTGMLMGNTPRNRNTLQGIDNKDFSGLKCEKIKMEMRCWVGKEGKPSEGSMGTRVIMWKFNKYMNVLFPKAKKKKKKR